MKHINSKYKKMLVTQGRQLDLALYKPSKRQSSAEYSREELKFVEHLLCAKLCFPLLTHDIPERAVPLTPLFRGGNERLQVSEVRKGSPIILASGVMPSSAFITTLHLWPHVNSPNPREWYPWFTEHCVLWIPEGLGLVLVSVLVVSFYVNCYHFRSPPSQTCTIYIVSQNVINYIRSVVSCEFSHSSRHTRTW